MHHQTVEHIQHYCNSNVAITRQRNIMQEIGSLTSKNSISTFNKYSRLTLYFVHFAADNLILAGKSPNFRNKPHLASSFVSVTHQPQRKPSCHFLLKSIKQLNVKGLYLH